MAKAKKPSGPISEKALRHVSKRLKVHAHFVRACLEAHVIEIEEMQEHVEFIEGSLLRLRRVQRICATFDVDVPVALILLNDFR